MTLRRPLPRPTTPALHLKPLLLSVLVGLIPVISGMLILYWQVDRAMMRDSLSAGQRAIAHLDRTLERADDLTARASALAGRECEHVLEPMRRLVTGYPSVRSMVLGNAERLYCGSELGKVDRPLPEEMIALTKLILRASSLPAPDRASLVFRRYEDNHSLNAVIDAQVLGQNLAYASSGAEHLLLEHNGVYLGSDGNVFSYSFDHHGEHHAVQTSSVYGYRVHSGYPLGQSAAAFKAQALPMLGTLLLLGVITAGVCHGLSRHATYKR